LGFGGVGLCQTPQTPKPQSPIPIGEKTLIK